MFRRSIPLNTKEVLNSKALKDSNISHDENVSIDTVLKQYDYMRKEIQNYNNK